MPTHNLDEVSFTTKKFQPQQLLGFSASIAKWVGDYSNRVRPLLDTCNQSAFRLSHDAIKPIKLLKEAIGSAMLSIPDNVPFGNDDRCFWNSQGHIIIECSTSRFFLRLLSPSEMRQSSVEQEAMANIECCRKRALFIRSFHKVIQTDQKAVSFLFSKQKQN